MNPLKKIMMEASQILELPADIVAFVPKIELTGTTEFSMEPHKGLLEYEQERISLASSIGTVVVEGNNLQIKRMNHQRITLIGRIFSIRVMEDARE